MKKLESKGEATEKYQHDHHQTVGDTSDDARGHSDPGNKPIQERWLLKWEKNEKGKQRMRRNVRNREMKE